VINGSVVLDSNEDLVAGMNVKIAEVVEDMAEDFEGHLKEKGFFKKAPEFAETELADFKELIQLVVQQERLSKRYSTIERKLNPVENANRYLSIVDAKIKDGVEQMVKLEPKAVAIVDFHDRWVGQGAEKKQLLDALVAQYQSKDGVIRNWEDLPMDFTRLSAEEKRIIHTALLDINFQDEEGNTLLHHAISNGQTDLVHHLLQLGAKIDISNKRGENAIGMAEGLGFLPCMMFLDPHSPTVEAIQAGLGDCIDFIKTMHAQLKAFRDRSDIALTKLTNAGYREFHLLGYSLREMDILTIKEKISAIEASSNLVGSHIYSEVPALMDQLVLFNFDLTMHMNSMEKAIRALEKGFSVETPVLQAYMHELNVARVVLVKEIDKALKTIIASPTFKAMHRAAQDLKDASSPSSKIFNVARIEEQAATTVAIANERALALIRERNATVAELQARVTVLAAEREAAAASASALASEKARLEAETARLAQQLSAILRSPSSTAGTMPKAGPVGNPAGATVFAEVMTSPASGAVLVKAEV
jgi:hypothetical protein